jgi:hypothetical protein
MKYGNFLPDHTASYKKYSILHKPYRQNIKIHASRLVTSGLFGGGGDLCGVSKKFGECYQKTNKREDTKKLTILAFKIIHRNF